MNPERIVGYRIVADIPDSENIFESMYQVMDYKVYELNVSLEECRAQAEDEAGKLRAANHGASIRVIELKSY